jgi:NADH-quinone oxidoreductase subunit J
MLAQNIAFGALALVIAVSALRVVTTKNVVHAALYLVLVLSGVAGIFLLLAAEFLAIVQVLVYIGAIVVLFLFGIMLTKAPIGGDAELTRKSWFGGALVGVIMLALLSFTLLDTWGDDRLPADRRVTGQDEQLVSNTSIVSDSIFSSYLIPFEAVSVLLTAALIGAIVIARKE